MRILNDIQNDASTVVSCWKLGRQITGGRWYELFQAKPKTLSDDSDYDYLIKLINPQLTGDRKQRAIDRLGREALATETIMHNNVVRLLDAELDRPEFFLVQPFIYGCSLDRLMTSARQMPLNRLLWVVRQIAEGIHAGHLCGRVHLGLDPSHVLLGRTGRVKVAGWSQSHGIGERAWLPHDQVQLARYMAPECYQERYHATIASDVYSMGALIYHAVAGTVPFAGSVVKDVYQSSVAVSPVDLMIRQPLCPPQLYRLVRKMLSRNPVRRPAFSEVLDTLIGVELEHLSDLTAIPY